MIVTRFAPSPTGQLHLGHAYSALIGWYRAKEAGGQFLLRIEDIDRARCRKQFETEIIEDLHWLGLEWNGDIRRQSEHMPEYDASLQRLARLGVLYPCFCSRKDIEAAIAAPHGPNRNLYPGTCRTLSRSQANERMEAGAPYALRLDVAKAGGIVGALEFTDRDRGRIAVDNSLSGDVVLARRDMPASYHLCVVVDDALQGVSLVTRGEDLLEATHAQRLIQALLDLPVPRYDHHRLIRNDAGERLSKRDGALSIRALREAGRNPAEVRAAAGFPDPSISPRA